jgi:hypothetical protein
MSRILVCGGRHFDRIAGATAHAEVNSRIVKATAQQQRLTVFLNDLHKLSKVDLLLHFNQRGAERLAAHWASISGVDGKSLKHSGKTAVCNQGAEACKAQLKVERGPKCTSY